MNKSHPVVDQTCHFLTDYIKASYLEERVVTARHQVTGQLNVVVQSVEGLTRLKLRFFFFSFIGFSSCYISKQQNFTYAQKSSTVSKLEMRRRFACHVLLLSFLKNHRAHLKKKKQKEKLPSGFLNYTN